VRLVSSGLLNAIDGVASQEGRLLILTTVRCAVWIAYALPLSDKFVGLGCHRITSKDWIPH